MIHDTTEIDVSLVLLRFDYVFVRVCRHLCVWPLSKQRKPDTSHALFLWSGKCMKSRVRFTHSSILFMKRETFSDQNNNSNFCSSHEETKRWVWLCDSSRNYVCPVRVSLTSKSSEQRSWPAGLDPVCCMFLRNAAHEVIWFEVVLLSSNFFLDDNWL